MDARVRRSPEEIRRARDENQAMRERDLAAKLGVSEAELVAAECGRSAVRIRADVAAFLSGIGEVGEVMALTRNESAVHEKIGIYDKVVLGDQSSMVLGADIDLRIFPKAWAHGFAVTKGEGGETRRSLQFFDAAGDAVHKVHLRPASDLSAYQRLVATLEATDQSPELEVSSAKQAPPARVSDASRDELRERWSKLTDTHQFFGMLRSLKLPRQDAVRMVGDDYAWRLAAGGEGLLLERAAESGQPIMCFVGNGGCIQIHSGPVRTVKPMGPWVNVMDETFHLHLRTDHIKELWAVRKPTRDGHVTSIEAYDAGGDMVIQFFGKRHEGEGERADWRDLAEGLPRLATDSAK